MKWFHIIMIIIAIFVALLIIYITIGLVKTIFLKNNEVKKISFDNKHYNRSKQYGDELFELIKVSTPATSNDEGFHIIREKIKEFFPLIHKMFSREKIGQNVIYTYKYHDNSAPNFLFVSHIDNLGFSNDAVMTDDEIYGAGTFDGKALLYVICKAVEEILEESNNLNVNLTIVITTDDTSTKEGSKKIVNKFLREGRFFNLVMEEGIGIVDPDYLGLKSHYALVGIGVTGELKIRFKKDKEKASDLYDFINEIKNNKIFKTKVDSNALAMLKELSKDMDFKNRFYINNNFLFKKRIQKLLDSGEIKAGKIIKTTIKYGDVIYDERNVHSDFIFELANHTTASDVLIALSPYIEKYHIEYEILFIKEGSKITDTCHLGFKSVIQTIESVFQKLYTSPFIITKISEKRYFDQVSDCVVRFSPLYYPSKTLKDIYRGEEHISKKSLPYGVDFFKTILHEYIWR